MCRYQSREDPEYKKVKIAIDRLIQRCDERFASTGGEQSTDSVLRGRPIEQASRRSSEINVSTEGSVRNLAIAQEQSNFVFN